MSMNSCNLSIDSNGEPKICFFCFDYCISEKSVPNDFQKVFTICSKYLHSNPTTEANKFAPDISLVEHKSIRLCEICWKSSVELSERIKKLDCCEKDVSELSSTFSKEILRRRKIFSWTETKNVGEIDALALPDLENQSDSWVSVHNSDESSSQIYYSTKKTQHLDNQKSPIKVVSIDLKNNNNEYDYHNRNNNEGINDNLLKVIISEKTEALTVEDVHFNNLPSPTGIIENNNSSEVFKSSNEHIPGRNFTLVKTTRQENNEIQLTDSGCEVQVASESAHVQELRMTKEQGLTPPCIVKNQPTKSPFFADKPLSDVMADISTLDTSNETASTVSGQDQELVTEKLPFQSQSSFSILRHHRCLRKCYLVCGFCFCCCIQVICLAVLAALGAGTTPIHLDCRDLECGDSDECCCKCCSIC